MSRFQVNDLVIWKGKIIDKCCVIVKEKNKDGEYVLESENGDIIFATENEIERMK